MVGVIMRDDDPPHRPAGEPLGEDPLPQPGRLLSGKAAIDDRPARPVFEQPRIDMAKRQGQRLAGAGLEPVGGPQSTGIGGDWFVLYARKAAPPVQLRGSGRAPKAAKVGWLPERQIHRLATRTAHAVTVPGAIAAWCTLNS